MKSQYLTGNSHLWVREVCIYLPQWHMCPRRGESLQLRALFCVGGRRPSGADIFMLCCRGGGSSTPCPRPTLFQAPRFLLGIWCDFRAGSLAFFPLSTPLPPTEHMLLLTTLWPVRVEVPPFVAARHASDAGVPFPAPPHTPWRLHTWVFPHEGHACPGDSPGDPLQPVAKFLCIGQPEEDTHPPPCRLPDGWAPKAYHTTLCHGNFLPMPCTPLLLHWQPCPPWQPLLPRSLLPGRRGDPYPRVPYTWWSYPNMVFDT